MSRVDAPMLARPHHADGNGATRIPLRRTGPWVMLWDDDRGNTRGGFIEHAPKPPARSNFGAVRGERGGYLETLQDQGVSQFSSP